MRNIFLLTVMLLLVSSCGLFKKTIRTKASQILKTNEEMTLLSKVDSGSIRLEVAQSHNRLSVHTEDLMHIEGEKMEISPDGMINIIKGKIHKKLTHHTDSSKRFKQYVSQQRQQIVQRVLRKEEKLQLEDKVTTRTARPAVTSMLYFFTGLIVLAGVLIWWMRRRIGEKG